MVFQATPFVVICYSILGDKCTTLQRSNHSTEGFSCPKVLPKAISQTVAETGRCQGGWSQDSGPQRAAGVAALRFSPASRHPAGQVARILWHHCPGWLCLCHGLSTVGQPHGRSLHLPDAAPTSLPEVHCPAWPCLLSLCCIGALPGSGGSWPAPRHWKELTSTLTAAVHAPAGLDFPTPRSFSF